MNNYMIIYSICLFFLAGILIFALSKKIRFPHSILAILFGFIISKIYSNYSFFLFPHILLDNLIMLSFSIIIFNIFSQQFLGTPTTLHTKIRSFKIIMIFIAMPILMVLSYYLFSLQSMILSLILSLILLTSTKHISLGFNFLKRKVLDLIEAESIKLTAYSVLIFGIILQILIDYNSSKTYLLLIKDALFHLTTGLGIGMIIGLVLLRIMKKHFFGELNYLGLVTTALITFTLSTAMNGSQIFALFGLGIFFGHFDLKEKRKLETFSRSISSFFEIIVYMIFPFYIGINLDLTKMILTLLIFAFYLLMRFLSSLIFLKDIASFSEMIYFSAYSPKDTSTALIAIFCVLYIPSFLPIAEIVFYFIIISILITYFMMILFEKQHHKKIKKIDEI